jgi:purine-binding chemotaxis protein CheW
LGSLGKLVRWVTVSRPAQSPAAVELRANRVSLVERLRRLEGEMQRTQAALAASGGEAMPGLHLLLEVAGRRALLHTGRVQEIVRLVAMQPLPGAPPRVLGTFLCRGLPVVAVHVAAMLEREARAPALDAQVVVVAGAPALGLVVDRVDGLVDGPRLFEGDSEAGLPESWRGSRLVAGLCVHAGLVLPLLDVGPISESLREWDE